MEKMKRRGDGACLLCGKPLFYLNEVRDMRCVFCGEIFKSRTGCEAGHFVCDGCHAKKGLDAVMELCQRTKETDPIRIAEEIMENPYVYMHGPEHHVLVGAALLTAYHNAGGDVNFSEALSEMLSRGRAYPGGSCGFWGCCGAAVSTGMFMSVVLKATPLTTVSWALSNEVTARALQKIAELGGPRCCKRNSFTAIKTASEFVKEKLGVDMPIRDKIVCNFYPENRECRRKNCLYYPETA